MTRERLITAAEAVKIFGKSRAQIYRWIDEHNINEVDALPSRGRRGSTAVYRLSDFVTAAAQRHAHARKSLNQAPEPTDA